MRATLRHVTGYFSALKTSFFPLGMVDMFNYLIYIYFIFCNMMGLCGVVRRVLNAMTSLSLHSALLGLILSEINLFMHFLAFLKSFLTFYPVLSYFHKCSLWVDNLI